MIISFGIPNATYRYRDAPLCPIGTDPVSSIIHASTIPESARITTNPQEIINVLHALRVLEMDENDEASR